MGLLLLLAVLLLSVSSGEDDDTAWTYVRHPRVRDVERNFDVCVSGITIKGQPGVSLLLRANESVHAASVRALGGGELSDSSRAAERIAAFIEHRVSQAMMFRLELQAAVRSVRQGAPALFVASHSCDRGSLMDRAGPWLLLDASAFNAYRPTDWSFYFSERPISRCLIGCDPTLTTADYASAFKSAMVYLLPGGVVEVVVEGAGVEDVGVERMLLDAGFLLTGEDDIERHGPMALGGEVAREALCDSVSRTIDSTSRTIRARKPLLLPRDEEEVLPGVASAVAINLGRRSDRWLALVERTNAAGFLKAPTRLEAVDGSTLDLTSPEIAEIFNLTSWRYGGARNNAHQDHGYRPRVIGCALSHLGAWERIADAESQYSIHLVLEDDVRFAPDFQERWASLAPLLQRDYSWDLTYLGILDDRDLYGDEEAHPGLLKFSARQRSFGAGAFAYLVRPRAARKLLRLARELGIQQAVDWWLVELFGEVVAYKATPPLAGSPQGEGRDSDNDELYDQSRLLLSEEEQAVVTFELTTPEAGSVLVGDVDVRASLLVAGSTDLFLQRRALAQICLTLEGPLEHDSRVDQALLPVLWGPVCRGLSMRNHIPLEAISMASGWCLLRAQLRDGTTLAETSMAVQLGGPAHEAWPEPKGGNETLHVALSVDGGERVLDCKDDGQSVFECVRQFCETMEPKVQCMARLLEG